jgi:Ni,Fe-hydrogenase III component G
VLSSAVAFGELTLDVVPDRLEALVEFLRTDSACRFTSLVDITAVDHPERAERFDLVYHFLSMYQNQRIRLKMAIGEEEMVPSLTGVHPSANWFEREVFDMFGILFSGHPDLRRILTDYGFPWLSAAQGLSRPQAIPKFAMTRRRSAWSMSRSSWCRNTASSISCRPGKVRIHPSRR